MYEAHAGGAASLALVFMIMALLAGCSRATADLISPSVSGKLVGSCYLCGADSIEIEFA